MAHPMIDRFGGSLLLRTGAVSLSILALVALATGIAPMRCFAPGALNCGTATTATSPTPAPDVPAAATSPAPKLEAAVMKTPEKAAPTLTSNDVIAATFAVLPSELQKPVLDAEAAKPAPLVAVTQAKPPKSLTTRTVRSVTIRADGTPDLSAGAVAYAEPTQEAVTPPSPAIVAASQIGAGERPSEDLSPAIVAETPSDTPAAASDGTASIAGKGANVRAAPGKSGKVLFALNGGASVTVGENQRGWLKVTDAKGRSGWVYKDYVNR